MSLTAPQQRVRKVLSLTGLIDVISVIQLIDVISVYPSVAEAVAAHAASRQR